MYKGRIFKIVLSNDQDNMIELINTSEMTNTTMIATVSAATFGLILEGERTAQFQLALQMLATLLIDAADLNDND